MFSIIFYLSSVNHIHGTGCRSLINQMWTTHNAYKNSDSRGRENYESRYIQCNEVLNLRKSFHLTGLVLQQVQKKIISEQMQSFDSFHLSLLQLEQYAKKNLYASNNWQILVCQVNSGAWVGWWYQFMFSALDSESNNLHCIMLCLQTRQIQVRQVECVFVGVVDFIHRLNVTASPPDFHYLVHEKRILNF